MDIRDLQRQARELSAAKGFDRTTLEQRALFIASEVGELLKEVATVQRNLGSVSREQLERVGMEIYDLVWNLCDLANRLEIDLEPVFEKKSEMNRDRRWE